MRSYLFIFILIVTTLLAIGRPIEFNDNLTAVEKQKLALERELLARQTVSAMEFTADQRTVIIPILESTVADLNKIRDEKEKSMTLFSAAIIKLREDIYINNGITDAVKQCVKNSNCKFSQLEDEYNKKIKERTIIIWNQLTPSQKAYIRKGNSGEISTTPTDRDLGRVNMTILNGYTLRLFKPETGLPISDDVIPVAVKSNVTDIKLLNLFNMLFITPNQSSQLMTILKSAKKDYDMLQQRNIELAKKTVPVLEKMLKDAKDVSIVSPYIDIRADEKKIDADYAATDMKYLKQLKEMLTENQIQTVGNFTPVIDLPTMGQVTWKVAGNEDAGKRLVSFFTSSNLIPLLQARIDGDVFPPIARK
jgi:hypothetical protein